MKRVFAVLLAALLLVNPLLPGVAVALEEAILEHVVVTPVVTGVQAEDGTYTSPVQVNFTVAPGDPDYNLSTLEVSVDGVNWWQFTGEWPLGFSEGAHTVWWRITESGPYGETLYTDSVSFTVVLEHVVVTPVVTGVQAEDGTYTSPVQVNFTVAPGDPDYNLSTLEVSVDGLNWWQFTGEWPLGFSEGVHTVWWRITESGPYGETLYTDSVSFAVILEHVVLVPTMDGQLGDAGWYTSAVTVTLAEAPESAPTMWLEWSLDGSTWEPYVGAILVTAEGHTTLYYRGINQWAQAGETQALEIAIDTRSPGLDVMHPSHGEKLLLNQRMGLVWNAFDETSGLADGYPLPVLGEPLDTAAVGDHSITVVARDVAGNETTLAMPYRVMYGFGGFEKPLAADGSSVFKTGETIGAKFSLSDAYGAPVSGAVAQLQLASADEPHAVLATGAFREAKAGKYACDVRTKSLAPGAYVITATLDDGESYTVGVTLK